MHKVLITAIDVVGLKKTKLFVVEKALDKFLGTDLESLNPDAVKAAIMELGILEPLAVEMIIGANRATLRVTVREKWSLFPLPLFMVNSDGFMAGGVFAEMNAFGINDKAFVTGFYELDGWMAMGSYMHAAVKGKAPGFSLGGGYADSNNEDTDQQKNVYRRYSLSTIFASFALSYPITNILTSSFGVSFNDKILKTNDDALNAPTEDEMDFALKPELSLHASAWDGFLMSERDLSLSYQLSLSPPNSQHINLKAKFDHSLLPGFKMTTRAQAVFSPQVSALDMVSPASIADILPHSFQSSHYAGISAGLEKYIYKWPVGTLSAKASYQLIYSYGDLFGSQWDHGATAALVFYLARLAIPAVAAGASYNVRADYWQGFFSIGISM
jgi:hypothetical protein